MLRLKLDLRERYHFGGLGMGTLGRNMGFLLGGQNLGRKIVRETDTGPGEGRYCSPAWSAKVCGHLTYPFLEGG